jgi:AraC-like DNA-binding protein
MTDGEHDFGEAFDCTAQNCKGKRASAGIPKAPEVEAQGATPTDLSMVAARLVEAACRARDGDREAAMAHIAHAVALLQPTPSPAPSAPMASVGERQVTTEAPLALQGRRSIAPGSTHVARKTSAACAPAASSWHQLNQIRLRRVLSYISINIDDDITLADLAGIAGYSPCHFARKFTLAFGVPPRRYVSRVRLQRAMAELTTGRLSLAEIALNAHFSSQASFTRAFHRATGMTPKEYQRWRFYLAHAVVAHR